MKVARASVGLLGGAALLLAIGTSLAPDLATRLDVTSVFGNDYLVVVPLGLGAAGVVVGALASRAVRGVDQATPPDPERVPTADAPGAEFDRLVGGGLWTAPAAVRRRDQIRDRLRAAAVQSVVRAEGCSRSEANRRVETGTWTADPVAAALLVEDPDDGGPSLPDVVAAVRRFEVPLQWRARRTARAIERTNRGDRA